MEAKEIYDVSSLATVQSAFIRSRYYMQLDKTWRIFFNVVKIFQKFLYENTLKVRHTSHKMEHFFRLLKK